MSASNDPAPNVTVQVRRRSDMPATGALLIMYLLGVVLFSAWPHLYMITNVIGFLLALVFVIEVTVRRVPLYFSTPVSAFALLLSYYFLQMVWAPGHTTTLMTMTQLFLFVLIFTNYLIYSNNLVVVEFAIYTGITISLLYAVLFQHPSLDSRVGSTVINQNEYAYVLMTGILLVTRRFLLQSQGGVLSYKSSIGYILFIGMNMYGILYLAGSRAGTAVTLAAMALLALYWAFHQPLRYRIWAIIGVAVLFVSLSTAVIASPQLERFTSLKDYLQGHSIKEGSVVIRSQMLKDGIDLWLEKPLTGWGLDQYAQASGWRTYAHNNYIELLVNTGTIGVMIYLIIYLSVSVKLVRCWVRSRSAMAKTEVFWAFTVLIALLAWDFTIVSFYNKVFWLMMGVVIAVAATAHRRTLEVSALSESVERIR